MTPNQPYRVSGAKLALSVFLAIVLGAASPLLTVFEASLLMPVVVLGGVFMVFLYVYAGRLPAWLFMTVQLCAAAAALFDGTFMVMLLLAGSVPAMLTVRAVAARRPFFEALNLSVIAYIAGMLAALVAAYISFGGGMIGRAMDALLGQMYQMPVSFYERLVETLNQMMAGSRTFTVASYREQLTGMMNAAKLIYEAVLPGKLLIGAALTGVLSALWGSWLLARRAMATDESYIPLTRWFLPAQVTFGLLLVWLAAFVMAKAGVSSGQSVHSAAFGFVNLAFAIQALAAIDRFFFRRGASDAARRRWVTVAAVLGLVFSVAREALFILGMSSAMFGSHGALKARMGRGNDDDKD